MRREELESYLVQLEKRLAEVGEKDFILESGPIRVLRIIVLERLDGMVK